MRICTVVEKPFSQSVLNFGCYLSKQIKFSVAQWDHINTGKCYKKSQTERSIEKTNFNSFGAKF